ncbi:DNA-directed RNA polymerase subunit beta [Bienertia sinuspersici]
METPVSQVQRSSNSKSVTELLKEIAMLEMEVLQLEKYIVSLYQKALDRRLTSLSKDTNDILSEPKFGSDRFQAPPCHVINNICSDEYSNEAKEQEDVLGCSIHRSHSSLSHHSAFATQFSPLVGKVAEAVNSYHSLPLTLLEPEAFEASNDVDIYNTSEIKETANWLSEEMIRCISAIYCELGAKSVISNNISSPAFSFPSSMSGSPHTELNLWSPQSRINSSQDLHSVVNYQARGHFEFSEPYCQMIEILQIHKESTKLRDIDPLLQKFRSLVNRLERVNPAKMSRKEKLAFWINVHNALVMHAFLVHGVPENKLKRVSLLLKAAYSIGSHTVSVSMIQDYVLGSQLPHPGQWFHKLLQIKKKFRTGDRRRLFAVDHSEPLAYFALCCGSHSDPPVHVYTPQTVIQDLVTSRNQYILSNYRVHKEQKKILLPKIVENYAKDSGLHPPEFMKIIEQILPADIQRNRKSVYNLRHRKGWKGIEWIPHDFSFRYQIPKEMLQ